MRCEGKGHGSKKNGTFRGGEERSAAIMTRLRKNLRVLRGEEKGGAGEGLLWRRTPGLEGVDETQEKRKGEKGDCVPACSRRGGAEGPALQFLHKQGGNS